MFGSKLWPAIAPAWYSTKMHVSYIIGLKTKEPFRKSLKIYSSDSSENLFDK